MKEANSRKTTFTRGKRKEKLCFSNNRVKSEHEIESEKHITEMIFETESDGASLLTPKERT